MKIPYVPLILGIANFFYGIPFWRYRYQFRSAVYNNSSWKINFKPWFVKETVALFTGRYLDAPEEKAMGKKYRWYLAGQTLLFFSLLWAVEQQF